METPFLSPSPNRPISNPASRHGAVVTGSDDNQDFAPVMDNATASIENDQSQHHSDTQQDTEQDGNSLWSPPHENGVKDPSGQVALFSAKVANANSLTLKSNVHSSIGTPTEIPSVLVAETKGLKPAQGEEPKVQQQPATAVPSENSNTSASSKAESLLLQQIHQILDQEKKKGTIVIRGNDLSNGKRSVQADHLQNLSTPIVPDAKDGNAAILTRQTIASGNIVDKHNLSTPIVPDAKDGNAAILTRQTIAPVGIVDANKSANKQSAKLEGVHQDISEQFLNAKIGRANDRTRDGSKNTNSGQKDADQANKGALQQSVTSSAGTITEGKMVESSFGQQLGQLSSSSSQIGTASIEGKLTSTTHPPVPEKELVANLIQRFNSNPRLQTSRITMQLNPAELGALKIDIHVKGDSISANIVAQSRQVLETLEKSIPRLRAVLEEQGFKIDSFGISMDGDGGNQQDFFQEQFSSSQHEFSSRDSSSDSNDSFDTLLDTEEEALSNDEEKTGVNLTV